MLESKAKYIGDKNGVRINGKNYVQFNGLSAAG
jgi:hypothetical protein